MTELLTETQTESEAGAPSLRILLVEDDFASRLLLQSALAAFGECHIAVNGRKPSKRFMPRSNWGNPMALSVWTL